jgi:hypothetical protein
MSHFSMIVVTDEKPTEAALHAILLPWHEYESTGFEEYVVDVDKTTEALAAYAKRGDDEREQSPAEWAAEYYGVPIKHPGTHVDAKYGSIEVDAGGNLLRVIDRTNPNRKWDWWQIGGRYKGKIALANAVEVDSARFGDVAMAFMKRMRVRDRQRTVDGIYEWLASQSERGLCLARDDTWGDFNVPEGQTLDDWIASAPALSSWGFVVDGEWRERGPMGWWDISSDDNPDWQQEADAILAAIRPDQWITVIDCHI